MREDKKKKKKSKDIQNTAQNTEMEAHRNGKSERMTNNYTERKEHRQNTDNNMNSLEGIHEE